MIMMHVTGMWSSFLGAVELYLLSCKFVFVHVAFHFEIYVANKVLSCFPYQYNMMKLAVYLQEIISDLRVNY